MSTAERVIALVSIGLLFAGLIMAAWLQSLSEEGRQGNQASQEKLREILERCSEIPELEEFITYFQPEIALEFYDGATMSEVVSVASVVRYDERYQVSFSAPVNLAKSGKYVLTGEPTFTIHEDGGRLEVVVPGASGIGPSIQMGLREWNLFAENDFDIETIRDLNESRKGP